MALGSYERFGVYGANYSPILRRKHFCRVFTRFAARFLAKPFFMLISFIFSYSENIFRRVLPIILFRSGTGPQRARQVLPTQVASEGYLSDAEVRLHNMHVHDQVFITKNDEHVGEISMKQ